MNIFDYLFTDTSKTQTYDEAQANYSRLQQQFQAQHGSLDPAIAGTLEDPGSAAGGQLLYTLTHGLFGTGDPNEDPNSGTGFGALLKDVLILAAIGAAIYLFVKLGGIEKIKRLAS